jgi:type IX secretion system PorP/SprF family membrane protein
MYSIQEASLTYAANVYLSRYQTVSLGLKGMFQQRRLSLDGLFTGMQFIPDRGFDEGLSSGEEGGDYHSDFFTLSLGVHWQQLDRNQNRVAWAGLSFFDFNKPDDSFLEMNTQLRGTVVASGGLRIYQEGPLSITPEFLYTGNYTNHTINIGAVTGYELRPMPNQLAGRVDLITKYVIGRSGIVGLQLHRDNFSVGFSYDFPVFTRNPGNLGAFEIGLSLRRLVEPRAKRAKRREARNEETTAIPANRPPVTPNTDTVQEKREPAPPDSVAMTQTLKERLQQKQDSVLARAMAGNIMREPVELERVTLRFGFAFNSTAIDGESEAYLRDLAGIMKENPKLRLALTGHTDNVGSDRFNLRLSLERANAIKKLLVAQGVEEDRIAVDGKGMREPLNENATEEQRAANRRVEMRIVYTYE